MALVITESSLMAVHLVAAGDNMKGANFDLIMTLTTWHSASGGGRGGGSEALSLFADSRKEKIFFAVISIVPL